MEEYQYLLDKYSGIPTWDFPAVPQSNLGKANNYLERYWLSGEEYEYYWKPILEKIFISGYGIADPTFPDDYRLIAMRGGNLFTESDFYVLMDCFRSLGDKHFVIIENTIGNDPPIKLKFSTDITWEKFRDGDFIATVIIDMPHREYFVYTDVSKCAKYVSSDHPRPLDIIAFKKEYESLFREKFRVSEVEWEEIYNEWLPENYKEKVINNSK